MHIPDGMLSPATSAAATVAMLPVWTLAAKRVRAGLGMRQTPLLSMGAAFCFTVMMFNIPALGGTTAHPVAGTLLAVLLGPWAAVIGISVALAIQALFFGDGGLLAFGANCFTMAFALPFVGYCVYRGLAGRQPDASPVRAVAAAIGAYVGLNAAATLVALLLGIQPALFHEPNGHALYFPFGLRITLPAMLATHLLIAGPAEALVTGLVVRYLQTAGYPLYRGQYSEVGGQGETPVSKTRNAKLRMEPLAIGLLALVALTPLGLLAKGEAWGEWDAAGIKQQIQKIEGKEYVPQGIAQAEEHAYKGVSGLQDYASGSKYKHFGYAGAGLLGAGAIAGLFLLGGRLLAAKPGGMDKDEQEKNTGEDPDDWDDEQGRGGGDDSGTPSVPHPAELDLPDWLRGPSDHDVRPDMPGRRPNAYLERTLAGLTGNALVTLQSEHWARQGGYLQRLDPCAKVIGFFGLIVVTAGLHRLSTLLLLYAFTLLLARSSRLPVGLLLKRVWLSVTLFVGALALPATLNIVTPGAPLLPLWLHPYLAVTRPGLILALTLVLRVAVAVTLATLLTLSARWNDLLRALRVLFVPRLWISVLAMTYRYLAVLMQTAVDQFVARRSRAVGRVTNAGGRRFVGASMGALFGKTLAMSEEVHGAMLSRGFNGDMRTLSRPHWRTSDTLWIAGIVLVAVVCVGGEHV
jgi:cobalt/nickel transport system permease protein